MCMMVCMSRTNVEIDDELIEKAMRLCNLRTKREAIQLALVRLVGSQSMSIEEQLECEGMGWDGDLDEMRRNRFPEWDDRAVG